MWLSYRYDAVRAARAAHVPGAQRVQRGAHLAGAAQGAPAGAHPVPRRRRAHPLARGPDQPRGRHRQHRTTLHGAAQSESRLLVVTDIHR